MRDIRDLSESFKVRVLNDTDVDEVFGVYQSNPFYFQHIRLFRRKRLCWMT